VEVGPVVAEAHRSEWGRLVSTLIRVTGDWTLAEDCAQEAFEIALAKWQVEGVPPNLGAWLTTVAKNRAIDRLRRARTESRTLGEVGVRSELERSDDVVDDRLRLIFTCCHPALALESRVALTLRTVAGLTTAEIARLFLVPDSTMAQRLVRAKAKIAHAGIPYRVPPAELLGERLPGVLAVLYLLFTEGYSATSGDALVRGPLTAEAIRLARVLTILMPTESEARALLALMLLHDARSAGRTAANGDLVPLEEQDRSGWDVAEIAEAVTLLGSGPKSVGRYRLQAVIAAAHAGAPTFGETDFGVIVAAYNELVRLDPSPIVRFNRAIAVGMADGADEGLRQLDALGGVLDGYYLLPAARADFLRRLGRRAEAATEYRHALGLVPSAPERRYLERRLSEVS
jgi:RNA polymerase sigma-70 factor, ECF subfamily